MILGTPWVNLAIYVCLVVAPMLAWMALGDRVIYIYWQQRGMEKLVGERMVHMQDTIDRLSHRLEDRELMLKQQSTTIKDLRDALSGKDNIIADLRYKLDKAKEGRREPR